MLKTLLFRSPNSLTLRYKLALCISDRAIAQLRSPARVLTQTKKSLSDLAHSSKIFSFILEAGGHASKYYNHHRSKELISLDNKAYNRIAQLSDTKHMFIQQAYLSQSEKILEEDLKQSLKR